MPTETAVMAVLTPENLRRVKAVLSLIRKLGNRNNELADAAFREEMDGVSVDTAQGLEEIERVVGVLMEMVIRPEDWQGHPKHEKPTPSDVTTRAEQYALATLKAGSHGKRKILWNAFFSSFKPDFYREGWSNHLWAIAEQIEYPECRWLAKHAGESSGRQILATEADYFLVRRLESHGLARTKSTDRYQSEVTPIVTEVGRRFKQFVWDEEMWRDEKPQG